ncbi:MAG: hypothetical protein ACJ71R_11560, partial [Nitrososphaeraceae archaeon]
RYSSYDSTAPVDLLYLDGCYIAIKAKRFGSDYCPGVYRQQKIMKSGLRKYSNKYDKQSD